MPSETNNAGAVRPWRRLAFELLEGGRRDTWRARLLAVVLQGLIALDLIVTVAGLLPEAGGAARWVLLAVDRLCVAVFALEYGLRLWAAPEHPLFRERSAIGARLGVARTPMMVIDALALVPLLLEVLFPASPLMTLTRLVRFLKLARYAPALATIGRVIAAERRGLAACVVLFVGLLLLSAALMLAVEGARQPERLGDMGKAMWWALVTLTKLGGSDVTPVTFLGRLVAATVMLLGIGFFALPVALIGRGFHEEIRRRDFVVTFGMIARVPVLARLDAAQIAELIGLLTARKVPAGTTIVREGDRGDALYLIASGEVEVLARPAPVRLGEGSFFGEMALISKERRVASVVATRATELLVLKAEDLERLMSRNPAIAEEIRATARARAALPPA